MDLIDGYNIALAKVAAFTDHLFTRGVEAISLYLLSRDNLKREHDELAAVFSAETLLCDELLPPVIDRHRCRVHVAGDLAELPEDFRAPWRRAVSHGHPEGDKRLYLCVAYDPLTEIRVALNNTKSKEELFDSLWVPEPVNLIIRSAGRSRLSNFLPLQSAYAELHFVPELFNDVTVSSLDAAIDKYAMAELNFGA